MAWSIDYFLKQSTRKRFILGFGFLTLIFALAMPDRMDIVKNYWSLLTHQTFLLQDFFELAGLSATFLNVALQIFLAFFLMSRNERSDISGLQIAALGFFVCHSFFGSHFLNALPILIGVALYAHWTHQSYKVFTTVSLFATATGPIISYIALTSDAFYLSLPAAVIVGIVLGFIAPPLAEQFLKFHQGLSLYNYGFTTGIIAMFVAMLFPYFDWKVPELIALSQDYHFYLLAYFCLIWLILFATFLGSLPKALANYPELLKSTGRLPDDFVSKFGLDSALLNMCLTSGIYLLILLLIQGPLNGPVLGALFAIMGFSAFGKHPRTALPVSAGVLIAALLLGSSLTDVRFQLALLFSTALGPIAGYYGLPFGILAGFLHYNLTAVTLPMHQGLTLYNNGFATGFVAAFLAPLIQTLQDHKEKWTSKK